MNKFLKIFIIIAVILYLIISFLTLNFSPLTWDDMTRALFVIILVGTGILLVISNYLEE